MKRLITLIMLGIPIAMLSAQNYQKIKSDEVSIKAPSSKGSITVNNINGPITIKGTDRNDVWFKYSIKVDPKNQKGLAEAQNELEIKLYEHPDSLLIVLESPFLKYINGRRYTSINSNDMNYWFICTMEIEVPKSMNLIASTVNDGPVKITNINGRVFADNVNGDVIIDDISGSVKTETINGDIKVDFVGNPKNSRFESINGNIRTNVPGDLSANVSFKSMNGDFYTDFSYQVGPVGRLVEREENHSGTKYKIDQTTRVEIGDGESILSFETLNGDMFLRKNK